MIFHLRHYGCRLMHSENVLSKEISVKSKLNWSDTTTISEQLKDYCQKQSVKGEWKRAFTNSLEYT
jgi:hypothetical protein